MFPLEVLIIQSQGLIFMGHPVVHDSVHNDRKARKDINPQFDVWFHYSVMRPQSSRNECLDVIVELQIFPK